MGTHLTSSDMSRDPSADVGHYEPKDPGSPRLQQPFRASIHSAIEPETAVEDALLMSTTPSATMPDLPQRRVLLIIGALLLGLFLAARRAGFTELLGSWDLEAHPEIGETIRRLAHVLQADDAKLLADATVTAGSAVAVLSARPWSRPGIGAMSSRSARTPSLPKVVGPTGRVYETPVASLMAVRRVSPIAGADDDCRS
jgi:hypothetical protein